MENVFLRDYKRDNRLEIWRIMPDQNKSGAASGLPGYIKSDHDRKYHTRFAKPQEDTTGRGRKNAQPRPI